MMKEALDPNGTSNIDREVVVELKPIPANDAARYRVPDRNDAFKFAQDYVGVPIPKFLARLALGIPKPMAKQWTMVETNMKHSTRNLVMNAPVDFFATMQTQMANEFSTVIATALTRSEPGTRCTVHQHKPVL